jgi:hypothetical protein
MAGSIIESNGKYSLYALSGGSKSSSFGPLFTVGKSEFKDFSEDFLRKPVYVNYNDSCGDADSISVQVPKEKDFFVFEAPMFDDWEIKKNGNKFILSAPIKNDYLGDPSVKPGYKVKSEDPDRIIIEKIPFEVDESVLNPEEAVLAYFEENFPPILRFLPSTENYGGYVFYELKKIEVEDGNIVYFYFLDDNVYQFTFVPGKWYSNRDNREVFDIFVHGIKLKKS